MCPRGRPRGRPRGQGRPQGLHLWYFVRGSLATLLYCRTATTGHPPKQKEAAPP